MIAGRIAGVALALAWCGMILAQSSQPSIFDFGDEDPPARQPGKSAPATEPKKKPPPPPARPRENLAVRVQSARIALVPLEDPKADESPPEGAAVEEDTYVSETELLIVTLQIENDIDKPRDYHGYSGTGGRKSTAMLKDEKGRMYPLADFGHLVPAGQVKTARLSPGETITDVLVFTPPDPQRQLTLFLPGANIGVKTMLQLDIVAKRAEP